MITPWHQLHATLAMAHAAAGIFVSRVALSGSQSTKSSLAADHPLEDPGRRDVSDISLG